MNVNINEISPPEALADRIATSADELAHHPDTRPIGPPMLIPEGVEYPGSYRVCYPVDLEGHASHLVWVDPEGVVHRLKVTVEGWRR